MKIWLDDERRKPDSSWSHSRSSAEAIHALDIYRQMKMKVEAISFDHDLGGDDTSRKVILWMCEHDYWPEVVYVHTANPVGREWIVGMCERYGPGVSPGPVPLNL